jgi:serine protease Do
MIAEFAGLAVAGPLSEELAGLVARLRRSVVVVRGTPAGGGSGVVWDERGTIVTNDHVVPGPWAVIEPVAGEQLRARVVARSRHLDLAVLALETPPTAPLRPAPIGDSTRLRVGELVIAMGNPLGERNAVTLGVISGAAAGQATGTREVIPVSITLQPGNSGGALADMQGRVVGIPNIVVGRGLALAVPSHVIERFLATGADSRQDSAGPIWL